MGIFGYRICAHFVYSIETETEIIKPSRIQKQINHMEKLFFFLCYYIWLTKPQIELINVSNGMRKFAFVDNIHMNVILSWCFFFFFWVRVYKHHWILIMQNLSTALTLIGAWKNALAVTRQKSHIIL